jgi:Rrf2 family transcriptional regulator, cysteine metabolism repressor
MLCATEGEMGIICDRLDGCSTKYLWARVRDAITSTLDAITLADLVGFSGEASAYQASSMPVGAQLVRFTPRVERPSRHQTTAP